MQQSNASNPFAKFADSTDEEPRSLGLVMVPGKHVVSINVDVQTIDV